jgi:hypothetical protein
MYREKPDNDVDSGWRFLSGHESQEYMNAAESHAIYDINTIANYDPEVIPKRTPKSSGAGGRRWTSADIGGKENSLEFSFRGDFLNVYGRW